MEKEVFGKMNSKNMNTSKEYSEGRISKLVELGKKLIYPERFEEWRKRIDESLRGLLSGKPIEKAIEIMEMIEKDIPLEEVVEEFRDQEHFYEAVDYTVLSFSKKGPEFFELMMGAMGREISPQTRATIERIKAENRTFAENELERNREKKKAKTGELADVSSVVKELTDKNGRSSNGNIETSKEGENK